MTIIWLASGSRLSQVSYCRDFQKLAFGVIALLCSKVEDYGLWTRASSFSTFQGQKVLFNVNGVFSVSCYWLRGLLMSTCHVYINFFFKFRKGPVHLPSYLWWIDHWWQMRAKKWQIAEIVEDCHTRTFCILYCAPCYDYGFNNKRCWPKNFAKYLYIQRNRLWLCTPNNRSQQSSVISPTSCSPTS